MVPDRETITVTRYTFTPEDRCKGGKATASKPAPDGFKSYAQYLGHRGLQALADKYFGGNKRKAGEALSRIGNAITDPFPANRAWTNQRIFELPPEFLRAVWGHVEANFDDEAPF